MHKTTKNFVLKYNFIFPFRFSKKKSLFFTGSHACFLGDTNRIFK